MKTYFNHLDIHTTHIFDFETECFFKDPLEFNKTQTRKILSQLIRKLTPPGGILKSLQEDPCPLIQNYLITKESKDFDYWFALKLRQYQMRLKDISDFLNYHLSRSFHSNKKAYSEFLKMVLLQYEKVFFNKNVSKIVKRYFKTILTSIKRKLRNTKLRKPKTNYQTLFLKACQNNSSYLKKNIVNFMDVWLALKKENFIHTQTPFENFKNIFKSRTIMSSKRIKWTGTNKELQWFAKYLVYKSDKVVNLDKDIWLVVIKCFVKGNGEEFTESQLRNASGNKIQRKESLDNILNEI